MCWPYVIAVTPISYCTNFPLFRELETAFEEERDTCKAEKSKVASLEESLSTERKKLQEEIDEKLKIIMDLSKQLEVHQKNFDALKSELGQVKWACWVIELFPSCKH